MENDKQQTSGAVRTIGILEALARQESSNLEHLAKQTGLPKATLLRFLGTLIGLGYVHRDPADQYSLTLKMFSVGSHSLEHMDLMRMADPIAKQLCDSLGETVHMGIRDGDHAVYVLKKESSYTIRMYSRVGKSIPLYCTGIGKVLLAGMDDQEIDGYLERVNLKPYTPKTIRDGETLRRDIAETRVRGWACDDEEHENGTFCLAAPIRDYTGNVIAAMSISWPMFRYDRKEQPSFIARLTAACGELSRELGWEA